MRLSAKKVERLTARSHPVLPPRKRDKGKLARLSRTLEELLGAMKLVEYRVTFWDELAPKYQFLLVYALAIACFISLLGTPPSPPFMVARAIAGFFCIILLPGIAVSGFLLGKDSQSLWGFVLLGFVIQMIFSHMSFTAALVISINLPLVVWILILNTILVVSYSSSIDERLEIQLLVRNIKGGDKRWFVIIMTIAVVFRLILLILAQDAIAPDAALYADYARGVLNAEFSSNVINDHRIYDLGGGFDYIFHQGFAYLFAVSWLLYPPGIAGPTLVLVIMGVTLVMLAYEIAESYFGSTAARWTGIILAIHPLFVFHSAVAYGPEITSLLFIVGGIFLLVRNPERSVKTSLVSGILFALGDIVWFPSYLLFCAALPFLLYYLGEYNSKEKLLVTTIPLGFSVIARIFFLDMPIFIGCWIAIFIFLGTAYYVKPTWYTKSMAAFFGGILTITLYLRWPIQITSALQGTIEAVSNSSVAMLVNQSPNPDLSIFFAPITGQILIRYVFFVLFHSSPLLLAIAGYGVIRARNRPKVKAFALTGFVGMLGTLFVFTAFSGFKDPLMTIYLYSDSRFFLSIVLMVVLSAGAAFEEFERNESEKLDDAIRGSWKSTMRRRSVSILILVLILLVPQYVFMQSGLTLIRMEDRYAWTGLKDQVALIEEEAIFLVDRAPEFSWLTNRKSVWLESSNLGTTILEASNLLMQYYRSFDTSHLIVDGYTIANCRALEFLLLEPISLGSSIVLGATEIAESYESSNIISAPALTHIAQTEPDEFGSYSRVFRFDTASFTRFRNESMLDAGWNASNGGSITNASGEVHLTIGNDQNSTNTWRPGGFDFDQMVNSGFLLLDLENISATIARVEVWDENGIILRYAENLGGSLYYCPLGEVTIGDIRIVIEGSSGGFIIVRSISIWQVENH